MTEQHISISGAFLGHVAAQNDLSPEETEFFADALVNNDPTVKPRYHVRNVHVKDAYEAALEDDAAPPGEKNGLIYGQPLDLQAYLMEAAEAIGAHSSDSEAATKNLVEFAKQQRTLEEETHDGMVGVYVFAPTLDFLDNMKLSPEELNKEVEKLIQEKDELAPEEFQKQMNILYARASIDPTTPPIEIESPIISPQPKPEMRGP